MTEANDTAPKNTHLLACANCGLTWTWTLLAGTHAEIGVTCYCGTTTKIEVGGMEAKQNDGSQG
jgi:hypothetical protein